MTGVMGHWFDSETYTLFNVFEQLRDSIYNEHDLANVNKYNDELL